MKSFIRKQEEGMIRNLMDFISIPTLAGPPEADAPLGREIQNGLLFLKDLAEDMGFHTVNHNNYALEVQAGDLSASRKNSIGIICHLDVVAAGSGWLNDAFKPWIYKGRLYGRGSVDDKGPIIACLYAMKYLADQCLIPAGRMVCMIVGTDEEENFQGIRYYAAHNDFPAFSFIPDASFPLIYGEKGMLDFNLEYPAASQPGAIYLLKQLDGGVGRNQVPSLASCRIGGTGEALLKLRDRLLKTALRDGIRAEILICDGEITNQELSVRTEGRSAHAMSPEKGVSAVNALIRLLAEAGDDLDTADFIRMYNDTIGRGCYGEGLNIACRDENSGPLTLNIGTITLDGSFRMQANIRYPMSCSAAAVCEKIGRHFEAAGYQYTVTEHLAPVNFRKDDKRLVKLLNAYRSVTGDMETEPITIGGATYTRFVPDSVAFGPVYANQEELAHEPNEYLEIGQLKVITEIYEKALENLLSAE